METSLKALPERWLESPADPFCENTMLTKATVTPLEAESFSPNRIRPTESDQPFGRVQLAFKSIDWVQRLFGRTGWRGIVLPQR